MSTDARHDEPLIPRLLCDVMIPAELSEAIRAQGYGVLEARSLPLDVQRNDNALLEEAARQGVAVVTCNYNDRRSNFCVIHERWRSQGKEHAGIILVPQYQISSRSLRSARQQLWRLANSKSAK